MGSGLVGPRRFTALFVWEIVSRPGLGGPRSRHARPRPGWSAPDLVPAAIRAPDRFGWFSSEGNLCAIGKPGDVRTRHPGARPRGSGPVQDGISGDWRRSLRTRCPRGGRAQRSDAAPRAAVRAVSDGPSHSRAISSSSLPTGRDPGPSDAIRQPTVRGANVAGDHVGVRVASGIRHGSGA